MEDKKHLLTNTFPRVFLEFPRIAFLKLEFIKYAEHNIKESKYKRPFMSNQQSFRRADMVSNGLILFRVQEFKAHNKN